MKKNFSICFINPPQFAVQDTFRSSINPPLNLAYLIRALDGLNLKIRVLDLALESVKKFGDRKSNKLLGRFIGGGRCSEFRNFIKRRIRAVLSEEDFTFIAINGDIHVFAFYALREAKKITPTIKTIVGGGVATVSRGAFLDKPQVDYVVLGEAEVSLRMLVEKLMSHDEGRSIPGVCTEREGMYELPRRPMLLSMENLPIPSYEHFDIDSYLAINGGRLMVLTARGCRGRCRFCGIESRQTRMRPAVEVVDEIEYLVNTYRIKKFTFFNSMMNYDNRHVLDICTQLRKRDLSIEFSCYLKADKFISEELFVELNEVGCVAVDFGIESGSQSVLDRCNKGIQIEKAIELARAVKKIGMKLRCTFIWGLPGETWKDFFLTILAYLKILPDCCGLFEYRVSSGSEFYANIHEAVSEYYEDAINIKVVRGRFEKAIKGGIGSLLQKIHR